MTVRRTLVALVRDVQEVNQPWFFFSIFFHRLPGRWQNHRSNVRNSFPKEKDAWIHEPLVFVVLVTKRGFGFVSSQSPFGFRHVLPGSGAWFDREVRRCRRVPLGWFNRDNLDPNSQGYQFLGWVCWSQCFWVIFVGCMRSWWIFLRTISGGSMLRGHFITSRTNSSTPRRCNIYRGRCILCPTSWTRHATVGSFEMRNGGREVKQHIKFLDHDMSMRHYKTIYNLSVYSRHQTTIYSI